MQGQLLHWFKGKVVCLGSNADRPSSSSVIPAPRLPAAAWVGRPAEANRSNGVVSELSIRRSQSSGRFR
jgi:hypothetical protein